MAVSRLMKNLQKVHRMALSRTLVSKQVFFRVAREGGTARVEWVLRTALATLSQALFVTKI